MHSDFNLFLRIEKSGNTQENLEEAKALDYLEKNWFFRLLSWYRTGMTQSKAENCLQGIALKRFKEGSLNYSPAQIAYIAREDRPLLHRMATYNKALIGIKGKSETDQKVLAAALRLLGVIKYLPKDYSLSPKEIDEGREALFWIRGIEIAIPTEDDVANFAASIRDAVANKETRYEKREALEKLTKSLQLNVFRKLFGNDQASRTVVAFTCDQNGHLKLCARERGALPSELRQGNYIRHGYWIMNCYMDALIKVFSEKNLFCEPLLLKKWGCDQKQLANYESFQNLLREMRYAVNWQLVNLQDQEEKILIQGFHEKLQGIESLFKERAGEWERATLLEKVPLILAKAKQQIEDTRRQFEREVKQNVSLDSVQAVISRSKDLILAAKNLEGPINDSKAELNDLLRVAKKWPHLVLSEEVQEQMIENVASILESVNEIDQLAKQVRGMGEEINELLPPPFAKDPEASNKGSLEYEIDLPRQIVEKAVDKLKKIQKLNFSDPKHRITAFYLIAKIKEFSEEIEKKIQTKERDAAVLSQRQNEWQRALQDETTQDILLSSLRSQLSKMIARKAASSFLDQLLWTDFDAEIEKLQESVRRQETVSKEASGKVLATKQYLANTMAVCKQLEDFRAHRDNFSKSSQESLNSLLIEAKQLILSVESEQLSTKEEMAISSNVEGKFVQPLHLVGLKYLPEIQIEDREQAKALLIDQLPKIAPSFEGVEKLFGGKTAGESSSINAKKQLEKAGEELLEINKIKRENREMILSYLQKKMPNYWDLKKLVQFEKIKQFFGEDAAHQDDSKIWSELLGYLLKHSAELPLEVRNAVEKLSGIISKDQLSENIVVEEFTNATILSTPGAAAALLDHFVSKNEIFKYSEIVESSASGT